MVKVDSEEVVEDAILSIDSDIQSARGVGGQEKMETKRKRKKRSDSKCTHSEESLTRQWGRLYCFQCQRANWKAARDKRKLREVK